MKERSKKRDSQYQWNNNLKRLYYYIVEVKEIECQESFEEEWKDESYLQMYCKTSNYFFILCDNLL